jgi:hypothetical protein
LDGESGVADPAGQESSGGGDFTVWIDTPTTLVT